jgi:hypothetical protein
MKLSNFKEDTRNLDVAREHPLGKVHQKYVCAQLWRQNRAATPFWCWFPCLAGQLQSNRAQGKLRNGMSAPGPQAEVGRTKQQVRLGLAGGPISDIACGQLRANRRQTAGRSASVSSLLAPTDEVVSASHGPEYDVVGQKNVVNIGTFVGSHIS